MCPPALPAPLCSHLHTLGFSGWLWDALSASSSFWLQSQGGLSPISKRCAPSSTMEEHRAVGRAAPELCARPAATSHSTNCSSPTSAPRGSLLYLVFFRALQELLQLGVQLCESPRYPLYPRVQVSVLVVFCIEVVFVTLTLLRRGNGCVFSRGRTILFISFHVLHRITEL